MTNEPKPNSPKGCIIICLGIVFLLFGAFPTVIYVRHKFIPTNTLTVTILDATGKPVPNAKLRFYRLSNMMLMLFGEPWALEDFAEVTADSNGRAVFRAGCDTSDLRTVELNGEQLSIQSARRLNPPSNHDDGKVWWSPWADNGPCEWKVILQP
jgi:hypothetical protein